jgi:hypothetical protein
VAFYQWSHERHETVDCYNTMVHVNSTLVSNITLPSGSVNGSSDITQTNEGTIRLEIEAVGLCGHTASQSVTIRCKFYLTIIIPL